MMCGLRRYSSSRRSSSLRSKLKAAAVGRGSRQIIRLSSGSQIFSPSRWSSRTRYRRSPGIPSHRRILRRSSYSSVRNPEDFSAARSSRLSPSMPAARFLNFRINPAARAGAGSVFFIAGATPAIEPRDAWRAALYAAYAHRLLVRGLLHRFDRKWAFAASLLSLTPCAELAQIFGNTRQPSNDFAVNFLGHTPQSHPRGIGTSSVTSLHRAPRLPPSFSSLCSQTRRRHASPPSAPSAHCLSPSSRGSNSPSPQREHSGFVSRTFPLMGIIPTLAIDSGAKRERLARADSPRRHAGRSW